MSGLRELAAQATPGPWVLDPDSPFYDEFSSIRPGQWWINLPDESCIGVSDGEANARLVALAPDMAALLADTMDALETLRWPLPSGEVCYCGDVWTGRHSDRCQAVVALLARFDALNQKAAQ